MWTAWRFSLGLDDLAQVPAVANNVSNYFSHKFSFKKKKCSLALLCQRIPSRQTTALPSSEEGLVFSQAIQRAHNPLPAGCKQTSQISSSKG